MNKTVNINLAGIFFHIDEDAYAKLRHYLDSIKRSFTSTQGSDEIIADIEARIAELFSEKIRSERQVISLKEVEEVIAIMGQPEDYMLDEEIFEDEPTYRTTRTKKQLFRDKENSYLGGVSSGLGHYMGISAIWIRLLWIILSIFSSGGFILIYIALWIFIPEAKTTADKLAMRGEPVTISNIERKIKEGFDDVSGRVKNIDYEKYGYKARSGADSAATAVGKVLSFLLTLFVKFIGIMLLLISGTMLIGLFIGLFSVGTFGLIEAPWSDYIEMAAIGAPIWLISLLIFFAAGIPFFFLFILGLKILMRKMRTLGTTAILVLVGVWLLSIIGLSIIGIQQGTQRAFDGEVAVTETLPITPADTLYLEMNFHPSYASRSYRGDVKINYDENNRKVMVIHDVRLIVRSTKDSVGRIEVVKIANGKDVRDAQDRAENIEYETELRNNRLLLNSYLTSEVSNHYREQKVEVVLYLPIGSTLYADDNTYYYHRNTDEYGDILHNGDEEKYLKITENGTECRDCPVEEEDPWGDSSDEEWENSTEENNPEEDTINGENEAAPAASNIAFSITDQEVFLRISGNATAAELEQVAKELKTRKNIEVDYSKSTFTEDGEIQNLSLAVDCNDGFAGETEVAEILLNQNPYGFYRNYQGTEKDPFFIGKM